MLFLKPQNKKEKLENWRNPLSKQARRVHELMCLMAVLIFPAFAWFDLYTIPAEHYWTLTLVRWAISLTIGIWLVLQRIYKFRDIYLSLFAFLSVSWFCCWACVIGGEMFLYQHNIAYCTVFLAASLFILWHWYYSFFVVVSSLVLYFGLVLHFQYFDLNDAMLEGGAVLLTIMILHPIIVHFRYESHKREYKLKVALEESNAKLKISKQEADAWNTELLAAREGLNSANDELKAINQHLEELVSARTQTLENTNSQLSKALGDLDKFLYSSYHDIKGPIARMRGLISLFQQEHDQAKLAEFSGYFLQTVQEMEALIEKLNRVNILNQRLPKVQQLHVPNLLEQFVKISTLEKIEIAVQTPNNLNLTSDEYILNLILECMVDNCKRYRSVKRSPRIRLSAHPTLKGVEFLIEDNGDGIPQNAIDRIFDMFYRGHIKATGHGLGLYLVKKALEKLGGTIHVESELNAFTRFTFYVPNSEPLLQAAM